MRASPRALRTRCSCSRKTRCSRRPGPMRTALRTPTTRISCARAGPRTRSSRRSGSSTSTRCQTTCVSLRRCACAIRRRRSRTLPSAVARRPRRPPPTGGCADYSSSRSESRTTYNSSSARIGAQSYSATAGPRSSGYGFRPRPSPRSRVWCKDREGRPRSFPVRPPLRFSRRTLQRVGTVICGGGTLWAGLDGGGVVCGEGRGALCAGRCCLPSWALRAWFLRSVRPQRR